MKHLVVLSGSGISAESGIATFRDSNGLWENYRVEDVATPEGFDKNPQLVLNFYNARRKEAYKTKPNDGHKLIAALEKNYKVSVITQNVDSLHEKAGSTNVIHLHGELMKVRSTKNEDEIITLDESNLEINLGDLASDGSQLRPHIVWFGEAVPMIEEAVKITSTADIFLVIGTSLNVYPAAGLLNYAPKNIPIYLIDPKDVATYRSDITHIKEKASVGMKKLCDILL